MSRYKLLLAVMASCLVGLVLTSCETPMQQGDSQGPTEVKPGGSLVEISDDGDDRSVKGSGRYLLSGTFDVAFSVKAKAKDEGSVSGSFFQSLLFEGQLVEFRCRVTCLSVDAVNGRAWIGGVVTANNSEHPSFQGGIYAPGRDVWFRVLDSKDGDRSTFLGFEGAAGFITSADYCAGQPWPADNARTHSVTSGKIKVKGDDDDLEDDD